MTDSSEADAGTRSRGYAWDRAEAFDIAIDNVLRAQEVVGLTVVASVDGQTVYERWAGFANREAKREVGPHEVYRLASMTKAVTCVTALSLVERGKLSLDDHVSKWLPYFTPKMPDGATPPITVRQLMTHTAGLSYGFLQPSGNVYEKLGVSDGFDDSHLTLDENLRRLASAPLFYAPGTSWGYSLAIDVLGAVIEAVAGASLPEMVASNVTRPLGLDSMKFSVPASTLVATAYGDSQIPPIPMTDDFALKINDGSIIYSPSRAFDLTAFPSGGAGMVGTAADYVKFLEAIRTGGGGVVSAETAKAFTQNAIGDLPVSMAGPGYGWGLGVLVQTDQHAPGVRSNAASWSWSGVYGTSFWVDPQARLCVVAMTNTALGGMAGTLPTSLRLAAYAD